MRVRGGAGKGAAEQPLRSQRGASGAAHCALHVRPLLQWCASSGCSPYPPPAAPAIRPPSANRARSTAAGVQGGRASCHEAGEGRRGCTGRALGEADSECPICGPGFRSVMEIRNAMRGGASEQASLPSAPVQAGCDPCGSCATRLELYTAAVMHVSHKGVRSTSIITLSAKARATTIWCVCPELADRNCGTDFHAFGFSALYWVAHMTVGSAACRTDFTRS